jgi:predicted dehydrogenase
VLVCTPATSHVALALRALDAGAHVFVEKPLAMSLADVEPLAARAARAGTIVQVGYNLRYHPAFRTMKRLVEGGAVGKVLTGHAEFGLYLGKWWAHRDYRGSYMADARQSGGLVFDVSHEMDILAWFLGEAREVMAYGGKLSGLEIRGVDAVKAVLKMASGALASLHIDCLQPTYTRLFSLVGEDAALRWDCPRGRLDRSLGRLLVYDAKSGRYERVDVEGRAEETYVEELRDFLRSVESGRPPLVGLREGTAALGVALGIQESIETGRAVRVGG